MGVDAPLFIFALVDEGYLLFLVVYFVITLSDLECDYLNARTCCEKLNFWVLPEIIPQAVLTVLLLITGHPFLFVLYGLCTAWIIYRYAKKPTGNIGLFDPTEIHNRQQLKSHMKENLCKMGFHLVFFFIYLYLMIYSLIKGDDTD
ncbi:protein cornichon homolog 4-like [Mya arenaria]|nr:protein cornichon homolog 4-like [Mya arenaria]